MFAHDIIKYLGNLFFLCLTSLPSRSTFSSARVGMRLRYNVLLSAGVLSLTSVLGARSAFSLGYKCATKPTNRKAAMKPTNRRTGDVNWPCSLLPFSTRR